MQAVIYEGPRSVAFREVDDPELTTDASALVRPLTVATCDLDAFVVQGLPGFDPPFVLGHEVVGQITAVGAAVVDHRVGDVVAVSYQPSCGHCRMCHRGTSSACREVPRTSTYGLGPAGGGWGGALADLLLVPYADFMLASVPNGVSLRQAASASDNVADAYRCVMPHLAADPGATVLVAGDGAIPLMAADCARRMGSERVSLYSRSRAVLDRAEALGGIEVFDVDRWPDRFPTHTLTVDCTSDPAGLRAVIASTEAGGRCTVAGMHFADAAVPMASMYMKGITLHTSRTQGASDLPAVLAAMAGGAIDPLVVDPAVVGWDDAPAALLDGALKTIVERPI